MKHLKLLVLLGTAAMLAACDDGPTKPVKMDFAASVASGRPVKIGTFTYQGGSLWDGTGRRILPIADSLAGWSVSHQSRKAAAEQVIRRFMGDSLAKARVARARDDDRLRILQSADTTFSKYGFMRKRIVGGPNGPANVEICTDDYTICYDINDGGGENGNPVCNDIALRIYSETQEYNEANHELNMAWSAFEQASTDFATAVSEGNEEAAALAAEEMLEAEVEIGVNQTTVNDLSNTLTADANSYSTNGCWAE